MRENFVTLYRRIKCSAWLGADDLYQALTSKCFVEIKRNVSGESKNFKKRVEVSEHEPVSNATRIYCFQWLYISLYMLQNWAEVLVTVGSGLIQMFLQCFK